MIGVKVNIKISTNFVSSNEALTNLNFSQNTSLMRQLEALKLPADNNNDINWLQQLPKPQLDHNGDNN